MNGPITINPQPTEPPTPDQERVAQLQHALQSRMVLEQAKGVLRERFGLTLDQAFDLLRSSARNNRESIHVLAETIVANAETPGVIVRTLAGLYGANHRQSRVDQAAQVAGAYRQARMELAREEVARRERDAT